jgi:23S rRNA (guanosine2251-2'-O)-methyltransferase
MLSQKQKNIHTNIYLLLHDIRSTHNVGAILRTADATGVKKVYFSGYTPAPIDRFGRARQDISKAALGAEKTVAWEAVADPIKLIKNLKKEKFQIVAVEQDKKAIDFRKLKPSKDVLIIMGNEVDGVDRETLDICEVIVELPMLGQKESLNVSVAAGIVLYSLVE